MVLMEQVTDMVAEGVLQPLLVTTSAISLATECVRHDPQGMPPVLHAC